MDKQKDEVLAKVPADRRRFVQTILGLAGYAVPTVRSFVMATATVAPAVSAVVTTTRNAWRPGTPLSPSMVGRPASGSDSLIGRSTMESAPNLGRRPSEGGPRPLLPPNAGRPGLKKP